MKRGMERFSQATLTSASSLLMTLGTYATSASSAPIPRSASPTASTEESFPES